MRKVMWPSAATVGEITAGPRCPRPRPRPCAAGGCAVAGRSCAIAGNVINVANANAPLHARTHILYFIFASSPVGFEKTRWN